MRGGAGELGEVDKASVESESGQKRTWFQDLVCFVEC